ARTPPAFPNVSVNWPCAFQRAFSPGLRSASCGLPPSICTTTQLNSVASRSRINGSSPEPGPSSANPAKGPSKSGDEVLAGSGSATDAVDDWDTASDDRLSALPVDPSPTADMPLGSACS